MTSKVGQLCPWLPFRVHTDDDDDGCPSFANYCSIGCDRAGGVVTALIILGLL
jgi:hypothetical protein